MVSLAKAVIEHDIAEGDRFARQGAGVAMRQESLPLHSQSRPHVIPAVKYGLGYGQLASGAWCGCGYPGSKQ
jgi:hypothetical protein